LVVERIVRRQRDCEQSVDPDYFAKVNDAYEEAFSRYSGKKILVPMDRYDFVRDPQLFAELSLQIDRELGR
jgi:deoxyadenosine/deoxycytidine kinase